MLCTYQCLTHLKKMGNKMELPVLKNRAIAAQLRTAFNMGCLSSIVRDYGSVRRTMTSAIPSALTLWEESHRYFKRVTGSTVNELYDKKAKQRVAPRNFGDG